MICFENFQVKDQERIILHPFNLELTLPFSYGIIGRSGSGKSTLAKALSMLLSPKLNVSGKIIYQEKDLYQLKEAQKRNLRRSHLKYLVQEPFYALNPYLKIKTQLKEAFSYRADTKELLAQLACVQLHDPRILNAYPHELSGGQRQRIALLQALIPNPKVLIADEPTTALDPIVEKQVLTLIKDHLKSHNNSLIFVSHDLRAIAQMTEMTLVMHEGQLVEIIPSSELFSQATHPYTKSLIDSLTLDDPLKAL